MALLLSKAFLDILGHAFEQPENVFSSRLDLETANGVIYERSGPSSNLYLVKFQDLELHHELP